MLLTCPTCARSYTVGRADLGDTGRVVICSDCQTQWFAGGIENPPAASNDDRRGPMIPSALAKTSKTARELAAGPSFVERKIVPLAGRTLAVATIAAALIVSVTQRDRIVRHAPRMAVLYKIIGLDVNPRGLAFSSLAPRRLESSDVTVTGGIRNVARRRVPVPRIAFEVRDAAGSTLMSWSEAAPVRALDSGATMTFASSPHHMPADSAVVTVRFASDESRWVAPVGAELTVR